MDRGAHFYRCDFQVHSPRDERWAGTHYATDEEREQFATQFVENCRKKGLNAVAITDHHDLTFFRYIRQAALNELQEDGSPVLDEDRLVVFPGIELTLGVSCQALLILDANFDVSQLTLLYGILGIPPANPDDPIAPAPQQLEHVTRLSELYQTLDKNEFLKGRYIVLPNVSDGGRHTLLRSGNHGKYKEMPCVGGYVDGTVEKLGAGNREILSGKNRSYGFKRLGIIQTSDCRREDAEGLGEPSTWIKWATPTAEAIRQACLANETRLFHEEPQLPSIYIDSVEVSNCKFLGPFELEINRQFNCLIGGRGTGKSTILEYVRWALCDQPPRYRADIELPDYQAKRKSLVEHTLVPLNGVVTVTFVLNGVKHSVRRSAKTSDLSLRIEGGEFEECTEDNIRELLPVDAYSQKQLSAVGVRTDELLRFIQAPLKKELKHLLDKTEELKEAIRRWHGIRQRKRILAKSIDQHNFEADSLKKQVEALRKGLSGISEEDQEILKDHEKFGLEAHTLDTWEGEVQRTVESIRGILADIDHLPSALLPKERYRNAELMQEMSDANSELFSQVRQHLANAQQALTGSDNAARNRLLDLRRKWDALSKDHNKEHERIKEQAKSHQARLEQIDQAEKELVQIRKRLEERNIELKQLGDPETQYLNARREWADVYRTRGDLVERKCSELTALSGERIRATLQRGAGLSEASDSLLNMLRGSNIRRKNVEELFDQIESAENPVREWERVLEELEIIVNDSNDEVDVTEVPILARIFSPANLEAMRSNLDISEWLELSLIELRDLPVFEYRQGDSEYIAFADASAGQQATALLRVLLNQPGPPLLIDQPEQDLDNQVVLEIVREIWGAKKNRQVIIASHNANIVVNGDADLVMVCDYRKLGDQSGGKISGQGAIDIPVIKEHITRIMEGGKEAFRLRKEKYGF